MENIEQEYIEAVEEVIEEVTVEEVPTVNRVLLTVYFLDPFMAWLKAHSLVEGETLMEDLNEEPYQFLVPVLDSEEETLSFIEESKASIFETIVQDWSDNPQHIETTQGVVFDDWFEWQVIEDVYDLGSEYELSSEDSIDEDEDYIDDSEESKVILGECATSFS